MKNDIYLTLEKRCLKFGKDMDSGDESEIY